MKKNHSVQGNGTRKGASRRRKELALALCVSLWMAGGSVASATEVVLDHQPATSGTGYYISTTHLYLKGAGYDALTIAGGDWTVANNFAKYNDSTSILQSLSGYSLSVTGGTLTKNAASLMLYGICSDNKRVQSISDGTVNITGGTLRATGSGGANILIRGIFNKNSVSFSDASITGGTVNISGGTLNADGTIKIYGIENTGNNTVTNGAVNITGGTLTAGGSKNIYLIGIANGSSTSSGGSVAVSGQWENGAPTTQLLVPNGAVILRAASQNSASNGNVTLSGHVGFKGDVYLHGRNDDTSGTGNTLHIGTDAAPWRGYTKDGDAWRLTNAVNQVKNFDTIALHKVDFTANLPTLSITECLKYYVSSIDKPLSNVTLDLTKLSFVDGNDVAYTPASGTKTLLDTPTDLTGMKLAYKYNGAGDAQSTTLTAAGVKVAEKSMTDTSAGVTLDYTGIHTVALANENKSVTYSIASRADKLTFGNVEWKDSGALIDHNTKWADISFNGAAVDTTKLAFTNPENRSAGDAMTLVANAGALANPAKTVSQSYALNPVDGLSIDAALNGSVALSGNDLTYSVTSNQANKLTFGDVEWKDTGALLTRPANITFAGADVDTTNINFTNIKSLEANKKMTLVSDFGNSVGTITGTKYKVGSTLEGTGKASLVGSDLIFTAETGTGGKPDVEPQEQTHNTVMGAEVSMTALSLGNDFIGHATNGLSLASNVGADGVSTFAQMGGGNMRQETGSHIDSHTWNAILALGHANKKERGTTEYGAFFEYGSGNYSTFNGDERGDGSMHYTGGGLLAKYTRANGVYVEGSLRAGTVHDDARNVLRDVQTRVPYSYETNAPYMGFHLGVGKEIPFDDIHSLDVYGKYFFNRRSGVSFNAGGHYDLDAVTSQVVRIGARYTVKQGKWNLYGGAAYEHELDGKAAGTADGVAIRGADTSGGSVRGEIGATMKPGENSPWSLDLNLSGFAGKKRGFTGGVSVAFMF